MVEGSNDFTGQADTPQSLTYEDVRAASKRDLDTYLDENYGLRLPDLWADLFSVGAETFVYWLLEQGWGSKTVVDVATLLDITHEDGSWV